MKFGPVPLGEAEGAIAAHSLKLAGRDIRKGAVLGAQDIATLRGAGLAEIVVARLERGDIHEDEAAARLARHIAGAHIRIERATAGRANLHASRGGALIVDRGAIDRLNAVDEAITCATLPPFAPVEAGRMVGTVKIIPYAVPETQLAAAEAAAGGAALSLAPFVRVRVGLIQTRVPGTAEKMLDKTRRVTEARLAAMGAALIEEARIPHAAAPLTKAIEDMREKGAELLLVFGASAIADRRDVIPEALARAGGRTIHFGMPVDPGNLLLLGEVARVPVLGAPGCARSPKENGFDWVLARLLAGIEVTRADIMSLGVGGLLMEIPSRPQPRGEIAAPTARPRVAAIVLAAGRSSRMGGPNKLLEDMGGKPVARRAVEALLDVGLDGIIVVTGHMAEAVEAALSGLPVRFARNPDYAEGLSSSLRAGLAAVPSKADAVLVALGDMPGIAPDLVRALIAAFAPKAGRAIVVPTVQGRQGHPVLWARRFFGDLGALRGDIGARQLLGEYAEAVAEVPVEGEGALLDVDTPEALAHTRVVLGYQSG